MNKCVSKKARLTAEINGDVKYVGCTCDKCHTDVYHTPSGNCVRCGQIKAIDTRIRRTEERMRGLELAIERYKSDIRHQAWV